jgi:hypothetical protein
MSACRHEPEVKAMLLRGHWPQACDPQLRSHIEICSRCRQQVLLAQTFQTARNHAIQTASIPHPGLLWWKAQLLRRNQALRHVGRPVTTAQIFALIVSIVATATLLIRQSQNEPGFFSWLATPFTALHLNALSLFDSAKASLTTDPGTVLVAAAAGAFLLLSAIVVYLASDHQ